MRKYTALFFSLLIHGLILSIGFENLISKKQEKIPKNRIIAKIILEDYKIQSQETPKDALINSDKNLKFKKQTISKNKRKSYHKRPKKITMEDLSVKLDQDWTKDSLKKSSVSKIKKPSLPQFSDGNFIDLNMELSKEITQDSLTQLNSAKYKYYSFYKRMKDKIRGRWESSIQKRLYKIQYLPKGDYKNAFIMKIDKNGKLADLILHENGQREIDETALAIFEQATRFQNPPKDIFGDKEYIYIKYTLNLQKRF